MYYQIYNVTTGKTIVTCPDYQSALNFISMCDDEDDLMIWEIEKTDHPLARR